MPGERVSRRLRGYKCFRMPTRGAGEKAVSEVEVAQVRHFVTSGSRWTLQLDFVSLQSVKNRCDPQKKKIPFIANSLFYQMMSSSKNESNMYPMETAG